MTELSVGALFGTVELTTVSFDRGYARVVTKMSDLGTRAGATATETARLDETLTAVSVSATRASTALGRGAKSAAEIAAADQKAAASAERHAAAEDQLAVVMGDVAGMTAREQKAVLSLLAAHENLSRVEASQTATLTSLARAQASVIGADERLTAAQNAAAASAEREAAAMRAAGMAARTAGAEASTSTGLFGRFGGGMLKTAGELGLLIGAVEAVKKGIDITKEANDFQRAMVQVQTNADVSATEVNKASGALLDMAGPVAAAPAELAVAWYHAKSVGLDYAKSIDTTRIAAEGARVGHADLEETMNALTSTVASNIPGVENMSKAMGQLIAIVGTGDMKLSDLNEALSSGLLTVVKGYGLSLTDVGAALATFGDNNIRGANAATMLRMAVQSMAVPAKAGVDTLHDLGLQTDTLAKDMQQGGLNKAILDLKAHLDAAGVSSVQVGAILTEVFGKRAGPGIAVLVGQVDRLESKFRILRDAGATFDQKWQATTQTASFALASIGHAAEAAGIKLTEKLGPAISQVANTLGTEIPKAVAPIARDIGSAIADVWHIIAPIAKTIGVALAGGLMVAVKAAQLLASVIAGFAGFLRDNATLVQIVVGAFVAYKVAVLAAAAAAKVAMIAQVGLDAAMDANPIIAVATALVALGFAYNQVGGLSGAADKISRGWDVLSGKTGHLIGVTRISNSTFDAHAHVLGNAAGKAVAFVSATGEVDKILTLTTDSQKRYAAMAGLVVKKNGEVAGSGDAARAAIARVAADFNVATQAGTEFAKALDTFSSSAGTSADRAALIGATLKAANGDALNYASAINAAAVADQGLVSSLAQAAKSVGKSGVSMHTFIDSIVNLKTGAIDFTKAAAAPLISGLQSIQTAAMNAAQATYQHFRATESGKQAADDAYKVYVAQTRGSLIDQAKKLHISADEAGKLADQYFGMPKSVKTLIESEGADPVVTVLNKIGKLLANIFGVPWDLKPKVTLTPAEAQIKTLQNRINAIRQGKVPGLTANSANGRAVIAELQREIDRLRQKSKPKVDTDTHDALHRIADAQNAVDHFRQKHPALMDTDPHDALHHIADAQGVLDHFRQKPNYVPPVDVDIADALHRISDAQTAIDNMHGKDIYVNFIAQHLGNFHDKPAARGGMTTGPSNVAGYSGMVSGPGTGTSDTAGRYLLSNREFVSTAASVVRNAAALEAGNRGATLVAVGGLARKLGASAARASVSVSRPAVVSAPVGPSMDVVALRDELRAIKALLADAPDRTGAAVATVGAGLYERAGEASARFSQRIVRKR